MERITRRELATGAFALNLMITTLRDAGFGPGNAPPRALVAEFMEATSETVALLANLPAPRVRRAMFLVMNALSTRRPNGP